MYTFIESYNTSNFCYTTGVSALREYILDILNTDRGTRPYYPDYGLLMEKYKFSLFTPALAQSIHADVYFVISSIDNISIRDSGYRIDYKNKRLDMSFSLMIGQEPIGVHLTYSDGGFR